MSSEMPEGTREQKGGRPAQAPGAARLTSTGRRIRGKCPAQTEGRRAKHQSQEEIVQPKRQQEQQGSQAQNDRDGDGARRKRKREEPDTKGL